MKITDMKIEHEEVIKEIIICQIRYKIAKPIMQV